MSGLTDGPDGKASRGGARGPQSRKKRASGAGPPPLGNLGPTACAALLSNRIVSHYGAGNYREIPPERAKKAFLPNREPECPTAHLTCSPSPVIITQQPLSNNEDRLGARSPGPQAAAVGWQLAQRQQGRSAGRSRACRSWHAGCSRRRGERCPNTLCDESNAGALPGAMARSLWCSRGTQAGRAVVPTVTYADNAIMAPSAEESCPSTTMAGDGMLTSNRLHPCSVRAPAPPAASARGSIRGSAHTSSSASGADRAQGLRLRGAVPFRPSVTRIRAAVQSRAC